MSLVTRRSPEGFTLVELLVVIGIIALLISILLPSLAKARGAASSVACKALLRQYWLAGQMYANDNKGVSVDQYHYADYDTGLLKYFNVDQIGDKLGRCPADSDIGVGVFGNFVNATYAEAVYKPTSKLGKPYTFRATIGLNANVFSALTRDANGNAILVAGKPVLSKWVKPYKLRNAAGATNGTSAAVSYDPTKVMVWADYQYVLADPTNPLATNNSQLDVPVVKIGGLTTASVANHIGSMTFRHNNAANAVFLDGHVGTMKPSGGLKLTAGGVQLAAGQIWVQTSDATAGNYLSTTKPFPKHYFLTYPFGPGAEGTSNRMIGNLPTISVD